MKPKSLTDAELNRWIAEKLGWTHITSDGVGRPPWSDRCGADDCQIPSYCTDLNACHGMEEDADDHDKYRAELADIVITASYGDEERARSDAWWHLIHALPRQRAEAFCIVMGGER